MVCIKCYASGDCRRAEINDVNACTPTSSSISSKSHKRYSEQNLQKSLANGSGVWLAGGQRRAPGAVMELTAVLLKPVIISNSFFVSDESGPLTVSVTFLMDASQKPSRRHGSQSESPATRSTHHVTSRHVSQRRSGFNIVQIKCIFRYDTWDFWEWSSIRTWRWRSSPCSNVNTSDVLCNSLHNKMFSNQCYW